MTSRGELRQVRVAMLGLGSVHLNLLRILLQKETVLRSRHGLDFRIVLAGDSRGIVLDRDGLNTQDLCDLKTSGAGVASLTGAQDSANACELLQQTDFDLLFEATPFVRDTGGSGLAHTRAALGAGKSVVLANKGPLVAAFHELHDLAEARDAGFAFSATVCGGLPVLNIGRRDMPVSTVLSLRGVFNSTSNFMLESMAAGRGYEEALLEAQQRGIAEADPSLDVGGWDTAAKLMIICNSLRIRRCTLQDIAVTGIQDLTATDVQRACQNGQVMRLVAQVDDRGLRVEPVALDESDFLATCRGWEMGVEIDNDIYGRSFHKLYEREPVPTAAAMLRDAIHLCA